MSRLNRGRRGGGGTPKMPADLSTAAKHEWRRVVALLSDRGALDQLDQAAIADYCQCWERLSACEADITDRGVLVEGGGGRGKVKNPACQIARTYRAAILAWCKEFGFTPNARARMAMPTSGPAPSSKWDATKPIERQKGGVNE